VSVNCRMLNSTPYWCCCLYECAFVIHKAGIRSFFFGRGVFLPLRMRLFIHQADMADDNKQYINQIKSKQYWLQHRQKKRSKLTSNLDTRLAHNTLGKEKSKYCWQYFTVSILLVVKSFMKNLLMIKIEWLQIWLG